MFRGQKPRFFYKLVARLTRFRRVVRYRYTAFSRAELSKSLADAERPSPLTLLKGSIRLAP